MPQDPNKRRWFRYSVIEIVVLQTLVVTAWGIARLRPAYDVTYSYGSTFLDGMPTADIRIESIPRPPRAVEIVDRGLQGTTVVVVGWLLGCAILRSLIRTPASARLPVASEIAVGR